MDTYAVTSDPNKRMSYNTFEEVNKVPYKIVTEYLWFNENIWKLLKYITDSNGNIIPFPLNESNLTDKEKRDMIYKGIGNTDDFNVFFSSYDYASGINRQTQQLRVYKMSMHPVNSEITRVHWAIELPCHTTIQTIQVDDGNGTFIANRYDTLQQEILKTLNGVNVGGIGALQFNVKNRSDYLIFNEQYTGMAFTMQCNWGSVS